MFGFRERICFEISKRVMKPPADRHASFDHYDHWRRDELEGQWRYFSNDDIRGKDVVDFGCGSGDLSFIVADFEPKSIAGIEVEEAALERARAAHQEWKHPFADRVKFLFGNRERIPLDDCSHDTLLAFDCVEHIMEPLAIMKEWRRVLRPGGKVLIWWSPYKSPYGAHLEDLVPIPWAHVIFGERAVLKTGARIYELQSFQPRPWHFQADGSKKPNPLRGLESFAQQGYLNALDVPTFRKLADEAGLDVSRCEPHTFAGSPLRKLVGSTFINVPILGEYVTSFLIVECTRR